MSKEAMKDVAKAISALREWVEAVPDDVQLPAMPGVDADWLDQVESNLKAQLAEQPAQQDSTCSNALRAQGKAYPRTCKKCGLGPCVAVLAQQALDRMAENARELGLDYEPSAGTQVSKVWRDGEKLMAKQVPLEDFYKPAQHRAWFTVDELNAWADKKLEENPQWAEQPAQHECRCNQGQVCHVCDPIHAAKFG